MTRALHIADPDRLAFVRNLSKSSPITRRWSALEKYECLKTSTPIWICTV